MLIATGIITQISDYTSYRVIFLHMDNIYWLFRLKQLILWQICVI